MPAKTKGQPDDINNPYGYADSSLVRCRENVLRLSTEHVERMLIQSGYLERTHVRGARARAPLRRIRQLITALRRA